MATLKIPSKTTSDTFNLQDFKDDFNALNTELGGVPNQTYITEKAKLNDVLEHKEQAYKNMNFIKDNGAFIVIGDSISAGYGISYNDMYSKKIQDLFNEMSGYIDYETITNFQEFANYGFTVTGTTSIGSLGASKKSLIMQPGSVISFTCNAQFIDFLYHQTPTSGSLEVRCNGTLYKTINCSGTDTLDKSSFPSASSSNTTNATYTVTCINASVEITGILRLVNKGTYSNTNVIRCAVSGQDSAYFNDANILQSMKNAAKNFNSNNKVYLIAIGTNDIYNATLAKTSAAFSTNIESIITNLLNDIGDIRIILTVPPISNEASWPYKSETHNKYRNAIYALAVKYNLSVIDYTYINFVSNNLYQDGIHPNAEGNNQMLIHILKSLSIGIKKTPEAVPYAKIGATTQNISNAVFASISFSTEDNDTDGIFDIASPTRLTCKTAGFYNLFATANFASNATGFRVVTFRVNGSLYIGQNYQNAVNGISHYTSVSTACYLNVGDYVEVQVYQTSGALLSLSNASAGMFKVDNSNS
jgi:lysophospholipase L1-like esterase